MKIKADFVTNSSSTSYIIGIPRNFNPVEYVKMAKDLHEVIDRYMISDYFSDTKGEGTEQDAIDYYIKCFIEAFNVEDVTVIDEYEHPDKYLMAREFGQHLGFVISSNEVGSEQGSCTMIPEEVFQNLMTKVKR